MLMVIEQTADSAATAQERAPLLQISGATLRFGGITALDRVTLSVQDDEICGLIGPNGAGKTTLFNSITRLYDLSSGSIRLAGAELTRLPARAVIGAGIARTFQNLGVYARLTVLENVLLGAHHRMPPGLLHGVLRPAAARAEEQRMREECMAILRRLDLAAVAQQSASALPYGTLKRVEIARALAARPRLLLLDEPAAGLTHGEVGVFGQLLLEIRREFKLAIVLVEHHMGLVSDVCGRAVVLHLGRKIAEGSPAQVRADPQVVEAYLGRAA